MVNLKKIETENTLQIYFPENSIVTHLRTALEANGIKDYKLMSIKRAIIDGIITENIANESPWYQDEFFRAGACVLISRLNSEALEELHNDLLSDDDLIKANIGSVTI